MPSYRTLLFLIFLAFCFSAHSATKSTKVAIIGSATVDPDCGGSGANEVTNGGCWPVSGPAGELGDFQFSGLSANNVTATSLAPFDTVLLNVASYDIDCDMSNLSQAAKTALITWVGQGHKLIISDSECEGSGTNSSLDYSWLPFAFTTANPGAAGANGVLTIVENSTLGSSVTTSPYYVDATDLSDYSDAVGDANVMTTKDAHWCVSMSAKNTLNFTGPVHTYARYPALTDTGLIIYNGFDQDDQYPDYGNANLRKLWVNELGQPFNPSNLPCGVAVAGITLTPPTSTSAAGGSHTVTATLKDQVGNAQPNITVSFSVTQGPNSGATGTCSPSTCKTGTNGQVTWTYSDPAGRTGTDTIQACFTPTGGTPICITASKTWQAASACPSAVVTLTALPAVGSPGIPTDVTVTLGQAPQPPCAASFQFDATFDPAKVSFSSARKGEALTAANKDVSTQVSGSTVTIIGAGLNQNTIANGNVAYLTFNLNSAFTSGSTPITMGRCVAADVNAVSLTSSCVSGSITSGCTCDVNKDGTVNVLDVQLIINQVLGVVPATCDLNRDGLINVLDVQKDINAVLGLGCN